MRNLATPPWQLPRGVAEGTWDYVRGSRIARDYDQFLADAPLTVADRAIVARYLPKIACGDKSAGEAGCVVAVVADLGCGTGRLSIPLARDGYRVVAVDLSQPMLSLLQQKIIEQDFAARKITEATRILRLQANLVELDSLKSGSVDHAICMFSTLGMIRGRENRQRFLEHARRILKPDGQFILHVHNFWYQLRHPGGVAWSIANAFRSMTGECELGDRYAEYRGINQMFIHSFRKTELKADLRQAGFNATKWFGILPDRSKAIEDPTWKLAFQLVGWVVVCR